MNIELLLDSFQIPTVLETYFRGDGLEKIRGVVRDLTHRHRQSHTGRHRDLRGVLVSDIQSIEGPRSDHVEGVLSQERGRLSLLDITHGRQSRGEEVEDPDQEQAKEARRHDSFRYAQPFGATISQDSNHETTRNLSFSGIKLEASESPASVAPEPPPPLPDSSASFLSR